MRKENLSDFLYKITKNSPKWHTQYNEIIKRIISAESSGESSLKGLSTDQKISVALNLSKMRYVPLSMLDWSTVSMRIKSGIPTTIISERQVHPRLLLRTSSLTTAEASIIFSFHPYEWVDSSNILLKFCSLEWDGLTISDADKRDGIHKSIIREALHLAYNRYLEIKIQEHEEKGEKMESVKHKLLKSILSIKKFVYFHT